MEDIYFEDYEDNFFTEDFSYLNPTVFGTPETKEGVKKAASEKGTNWLGASPLNFDSIKNNASKQVLGERKETALLLDPNKCLLKPEKCRCNSINISFVDDYDYSKDIKHKIDLEEDINQIEISPIINKTSPVTVPSSNASSRSSFKFRNGLKRGESWLTKASEAFVSYTSEKDNETNQQNEIKNKIFREDNLIMFMIRRVDKKTGKTKCLTKHRKLIINCSHIHEEYYAKGMCKNCYHNKGQKSKKASKCPHTSKSHYARGLWKNCYLYSYHQNKKSSEFEKSAETGKTPS